VVAHKLARSAEPLVCNLSVGVIPEIIWEDLCNNVHIFNIFIYKNIKMISKDRVRWCEPLHKFRTSPPSISPITTFFHE
jgi:hypothetical protein